MNKKTIEFSPAMNIVYLIALLTFPLTDTSIRGQRTTRQINVSNVPLFLFPPAAKKRTPDCRLARQPYKQREHKHEHNEHFLNKSGATTYYYHNTFCLFQDFQIGNRKVNFKKEELFIQHLRS